MSAAVCVLALLTPARALAQHVEDGASARIRVGPLGLTPRISIRNFGVDSNALQSADAPRKDFTATFVPELDSFFRFRDVRLAGRTTSDWTYYGHTRSQRSIGRGANVMGELRLSRFSPYGGLSYLRTEQPTSLEVTTRLPQTTTQQRIGVSAEVSPGFRVDVEGMQSSLALDDVTQNGTDYANALNRTDTTMSVAANYELTPLTTLVVRTAVQHDRFDFTPLRNSNSVSITPGFEFKPFALISGKAFVGYRRFTALDPSVPDYAGLTAEVNVTYVVREMTKVFVNARRDLEYSFENLQPYYIASGADFMVMQMFGPRWDLLAKTGRSRLNYHNIVTTAGEERRDLMSNWGLGLGRHLSGGVRVGFDADYLRRVSVIDGRGFHGFRFGGSVTYGS